MAENFCLHFINEIRLNANAIENACFRSLFHTSFASFCFYISFRISSVRVSLRQPISHMNACVCVCMLISKSNLCTHAIMLLRINTFLSATEILAHALHCIWLAAHSDSRSPRRYTKCYKCKWAEGHVILHKPRYQNNHQMFSVFLVLRLLYVWFICSYVRCGFVVVERHCFEYSVGWSDRMNGTLYIISLRCYPIYIEMVKMKIINLHIKCKKLVIQKCGKFAPVAYCGVCAFFNSWFKYLEFECR